VALLGEDTFEGAQSLSPQCAAASGEHEVIWIDAQSFLDVRLDRMSFNSAGVPGIVSIVYRDFATSPVENSDGRRHRRRFRQNPDKMIIEKVEMNPALDSRTFRKPATMRTILGPAQSAQAAPATQEPARP